MKPSGKMLLSLLAPLYDGPRAAHRGGLGRVFGLRVGMTVGKCAPEASKL
jgi:hypothetical protein